MFATVLQHIKKLPPIRAIQRKIIAKAAATHFDGIESVAKVLRDSPLIDWRAYAARSGCEALGYDPAFHYVLAGEQEGVRAWDFDAKFYAKRYSDAGSAGGNMLLHYLTAGRREGRLRNEDQLRFELPRAANADRRPVIYIVDHQASRTGAPILGWNLIERLKARYFIVSILFTDDDLFEAFEASADVAVACPRTPQDRAPVIARLVNAYRPDFAVLNSVESRLIHADLAAAGIPYVLLVQEFGCVYGLGGLEPVLVDAASIIFASKLIMESTVVNNPAVDLARCFVQPQGRSRIPPITSRERRRRPQADAARAEALRATLRPASERRRFIVTGLGSVDMRKGVDLFLSAATNLLRRRPDLDVHFFWIGHFSVEGDEEHPTFRMFLQEQLARAPLDDRFHMLPSTPDIDVVYAEMDLLFLSSRLDPMPNVCIDAGMAGKPVVCFENGTGFAELLQGQPDLDRLVVPFLDVGAAADAIEKLADEPDDAAALGARVRQLCETTFDMDAYVALIERLGREAAGRSPRPAAA